MIIIVMGVTGTGKTTIGQAIAARLRLPFFDADDFHSAENIAKMRAGTPLTDDDRAPWLSCLNELLKKHVSERKSEGAVLACSALKAAYRERLRCSLHGVRFIYLRGSREILNARLIERRGHYMNPALLDSQLATLEPPTELNNVIAIDIASSLLAVIAEIESRLSTGSK